MFSSMPKGTTWAETNLAKPGVLELRLKHSQSVENILQQVIEVF